MDEIFRLEVSTLRQAQGDNLRYMNKAMLRDMWLQLVNIYYGIKLHFLSLFINKIPEDWSRGEKIDVVVVQGFPEKWTLLSEIAQHISDKGYRVHMMDDLGRMFKSFEESSRIIDEFIKKKELKEFYIVGHSKGGLLARYYAKNYQSGLKGFMCIASPHKGTIWARTNLLALNEMTYPSKFLEELNNFDYSNLKTMNVFGRIDNIVQPHSSFYLDDIENKEIDDFLNNISA